MGKEPYQWIILLYLVLFFLGKGILTHVHQSWNGWSTPRTYLFQSLEAVVSYCLNSSCVLLSFWLCLSLSHLLYGRSGSWKSMSLRGGSLLWSGGLSFLCETSWVGWRGMMVWFGEDTCVHTLASSEYSISRKGLSCLENVHKSRQTTFVWHYIYAIAPDFVSKESKYYYKQAINVLLMQQSQNSFDKMKKNSSYKVKWLISKDKFKKTQHYSLEVEVSGNTWTWASVLWV